ncbi:hypothetical protein H8B09_21180 [Paenibacillus sp. PR3]|uniref:Uncharacterized protein n=1 Tax=Paenibacillus terricola TaxID=2763503 RepID=A0ABR8N0B9_9BACL|nr:hypothetical protein [Paenibacillus terricola]MBD3921295.1 hypothetical protein [Paenibacillus terricola]
MLPIPAARSNSWYKFIIPATSILAIILILFTRFVLFDQPFTLVIALRFTLLAIVPCIIAGAAGWLGARIMWLIMTLSVLIGLIWMAYLSTGHTGWEDLSSLLVFFLSILLGVIIGLIAELAAFLYRRLARR